MLPAQLESVAQVRALPERDAQNLTHLALQALGAYIRTLGALVMLMAHMAQSLRPDATNKFLGGI